MKMPFQFIAAIAACCACTSEPQSNAPPLPQQIAAPNIAVTPPPAPPPPSGFQPRAPILAPPPTQLPELVVTPSAEVGTGDVVSPHGKGTSAKKKLGEGQSTGEPTTPKVPQGPAISKQEAEKILKPAILACMKKEAVYYLIVRVGQGYGKHKPEEMPPLTLVEDSDVNYKSVPKLEKTALGKCILAAAAPIRTSAFRGNYMSFVLTNEAAPDPMKGAAVKLNYDEAQKALSALDGEARACRQKHPLAEWEGRTLNLNVRFYGYDGSVGRVEVFYIDAKSALGKCLSGVYKKAKVSRFRKEQEDFHYALKP